MKEVEENAGFNSYATAIQIILIPHSLGLDFASDNEDNSLDEIIKSASEYVLVLTRDHNRRLLRGIKDVKDIHEHIDLTCLDPEIPEGHYPAKVILQLTHGYLKLVQIEKSTERQEIKELL